MVRILLEELDRIAEKKVVPVYVEPLVVLNTDPVDCPAYAAVTHENVAVMGIPIALGDGNRGG